MKPDSSDPERSNILDWRKLRFDQLWRLRQILDSTYMASLIIDGYSPSEACTELNLLKMEK
jgi:hypothetical protein